MEKAKLPKWCPFTDRMPRIDAHGEVTTKLDNACMERSCAVWEIQEKRCGLMPHPPLDYVNVELSDSTPWNQDD